MNKLSIQNLETLEGLRPLCPDCGEKAYISTGYCPNHQKIHCSNGEHQSGCFHKLKNAKGIFLLRKIK